MQAAELTSRLSTVLSERTGGNQPTIINLVGDATVFRPHSRIRPPSCLVTLDALLSRQTCWMPVGRFSRVLEPVFSRSAMIHSRDGWGGAVLPYLTVFACDWAATLARQMRVTLSCPVKQHPIRCGFRQDYAACLGDARRAIDLTSQTVDVLMQVVRKPPGRRPRMRPPAMLRLEPDGLSTRVIWLARDGEELGRQTLDRLAARIGSEPRIAALLRQAEDLRRRQDDHRERGDRVLQAMCPALAEAVKRARLDDRSVGYRMCSKTVRGLPAEVYVFLGLAPDTFRYAYANVVARRAHEDFVLENLGGQLFYFPPVQLQAMVEFIPSDPPSLVPLPMVRMPSHQPRWVHPYTGSLHADRFADVQLLSDGSQEAMAEVSDDARRLVGGLLSKHIVPGATTGCMCLSGQDSKTAQLARQAGLAAGIGKEPDLFELVRGLWEILRLGLTRGHENNASTPIVELSTHQMPYPIPSPATLAGTKLAARTFPFSRNRRMF